VLNSTTILEFSISAVSGIFDNSAQIAGNDASTRYDYRKRILAYEQMTLLKWKIIDKTFSTEIFSDESIEYRKNMGWTFYHNDNALQGYR
jgi:hypothetical protein